MHISISGCSFLQPIENFTPIGAATVAKNLKIGLLSY